MEQRQKPVFLPNLFLSEAADPPTKKQCVDRVKRDEKRVECRLALMAKNQNSTTAGPMREEYMCVPVLRDAKTGALKGLILHDTERKYLIPMHTIQKSCYLWNDDGLAAPFDIENAQPPTPYPDDHDGLPWASFDPFPTEDGLPPTL